MLQIGTVAPDVLELLRKLQSIPDLSDTRLVGGTALALHLGHRLSVDLDLFGNFEQETITETLKSESFNSFLVLKESKFIKQYFINQVKIDIVKFGRYPWLEETIVDNQIKIAGMKDIAAMKVAAITNRGSRKDFIDLYFLLKVFDLSEILKFYESKFFDADIIFAIRSLSYFVDAEKADMPKMLIPTSWEDVKEKIITEVKKI